MRIVLSLDSWPALREFAGDDRSDLGAAVGLGLGYVVCFWAANFGVGMNPEVYYIDRLPVHVDGVEFALVGVASVLVCVLATVFPAVAASRLHPVEELRYE